MPFRELGQKKLQELNQKGTQMKSAPKSKPFTNVEPLRVPIVEAYPDEPQPVNPSKNRFFQPIRSQDLTVTPKIEEYPNMRFERIKADTSVALPHVIPEDKKQ